MSAKRHYLAHGIDQQRRWPQAERAELPEDLHCAAGIFGWAIAALAVWLVVALALCA